MIQEKCFGFSFSNFNVLNVRKSLLPNCIGCRMPGCAQAAFETQVLYCSLALLLAAFTNVSYVRFCEGSLEREHYIFKKATI